MTQPSADHNKAFCENKEKQALTRQQKLKSFNSLSTPARILCFTSFSCFWGWGFLCAIVPISCRMWLRFATIFLQTVSCLWENCSFCSKNIRMKDHLADDVSLKVSRLFSQIDLTNNFKILANFVQDFLKRGWVLVYGCISAKQLRKCLSHAVHRVWCLYLVLSYLCWGFYFCSLFVSVTLFSSLRLSLNIVLIVCVLF